MTTKDEVIAMHEQDPSLTASEIAKALGCGNAYVRATASREGLKLGAAYKWTASELRQKAAKASATARACLARAAEIERRAIATPPK